MRNECGPVIFGAATPRPVKNLDAGHERGWLRLLRSRKHGPVAQCKPVPNFSGPARVPSRPAEPHRMFRSSLLVTVTTLSASERK
jgi:hypothetical protein